MDYVTFTTVTIWIIVLVASPGKSIDTCFSHTCGSSQQSDTLACNKSQIWISDVTSGHHRNETALIMSKQSCMGQEKCDIRNICPASRNDLPLIIHYMCVNVTHTKTSACRGKVQEPSGHIQNNGYPRNTQRPRHGGREYLCNWNISPPNGSLVAITILDISLSGKDEECEAGLVVSGQSCEDGNKFAPRILCKGEAGTKLVRCGRVSIKLRRSEKVYPLRFWLSFQVQQIGQSTGSHSTLPCSVNGYNQGNSANSSGQGSTMTASPFENADMADLLIILLCLISGISIVLLVILIVFCVRWRTSQYGRSEPLYSYTDISPGLQTHYEYISSLEPDTDKSSRPELVDGYFEVADALPITERGETPTSPAYAEVENFPQLRRQALSQESLSSRGASSPDGAAASSFTPRGGAAAASRGSHTDDQAEDAGSHSSSVDIPSRGGSVRGGRSKRTVLDRLKGFGDKEKRLHTKDELTSPTHGNSSKGLSSKSNKVGSPSGTSWQQKIARRFGSRENVVSSPDIPDTTSEAGSEPAYESIGEFVPLPTSKPSIKTKFKIGGDQTKPALPTSGPPSRNKSTKVATKLGTNAPDKASFSPTSSQPSSYASGSRKEHIEFVSKDQKTSFNHQRRGAQTNATSSSPTKLKNAKLATSDFNSGKRNIFPGRSSSNATNKTSPLMPITDNKKNDMKNKECSGTQQPGPQGTKNNNYKRNTPKDIPRSKGIVKNGIQLFEQNSSTSNE